MYYSRPGTARLNWIDLDEWMCECGCLDIIQVLKISGQQESIYVSTQ
jgi:hypothetical protein